MVGVAYVAQDIDATGGTPGYTFNFSGSMPPGLTLDSGTGVISGTPDPNSSDTYVFTVFAVDSNDCVGSEDYVININDPGCPAITVNPPSLPDGTVGVAYDEQLSQTGGANPVDFDIVSGDTPSGITMDLNGNITGTPDTPGTSDFVGRVSDKDGCLATREYSITIIGDTALFFDDFNNAVVDWQVIKPSFNETTVPGSLRGVPVGRKAVVVASPVFAGCSTCSIETNLSTAGGPFAKVWVLGWWTDKRNTIELLLKESVNKWVMKERVGGVVVKKAKGLSTINPNTVYDVLITYNGTTFEVFVDGVSLFQMTPVSAHTGTVGFQVANTSANFNDITVD